MRLRAWTNAWLDYDFEPGSGTYSRRPMVRRTAARPFAGFGTVERAIGTGPVFFALYTQGGHVRFQAGLQSWPADDPGVRFSHRVEPDGITSAFMVHRNDSCEFQCRYRHRIRSWFARFDPTYDALDFDEDHLLAHVAHHRAIPAQATNWRE